MGLSAVRKDAECGICLTDLRKCFAVCQKDLLHADFCADPLQSVPINDRGKVIAAPGQIRKIRMEHLKRALFSNDPAATFFFYKYPLYGGIGSFRSICPLIRRKGYSDPCCVLIFADFFIVIDPAAGNSYRAPIPQRKIAAGLAGSLGKQFFMGTEGRAQGAVNGVACAYGFAVSVQGSRGSGAPLNPGGCAC